MSGICEPIAEGIFVTGDYGAIAIHFKPGEEWTFRQDEDHKDRLVACRDCRPHPVKANERIEDDFCHHCRYVKRGGKH